MNVLSRKMFQKARPRPARDALNKAGGIMSSSPELMDTVQMFQGGGGISLAPAFSAARNVNTYGDSTVDQYGFPTTNVFNPFKSKSSDFISKAAPLNDI